MRLVRKLAMVVVLLGCVGVSAPAAAQSDEEVTAAWLVLSTTTTGIAGTIGGIVLTIYLVSRDSKSAMKDYLRHNAVAVKRDVTLGGGATVDDIAFIIGVPAEHVPRFAVAVRERRKGLLSELGTTPIDDARTERFLEVLWDAVASETQVADAVMHNRYWGG